MKVWICWTADGYESWEIKKIFDSEDKAKKWVEELRPKIQEWYKLIDIRDNLSVSEQQEEWDRAHDNVLAFGIKHDLLSFEKGIGFDEWEVE